MYYTQQDYITTRKTARSRVIAGVALICAFVAGVAVCTVLKLRIAQLIVAGVGFICCYFVWSLKIAPWISYNRFIKDLKAGQRRTMACAYVGVSDSTRVFDGVEVYDVTVSVGETEEDERLYVLDADKTLEPLEKGERLEVTSFGNFITDIKKA